MDNAEVRIYAMKEEGRVGVQTPDDGFITFDPKEAVNLAQSLMLCAMEVSPDMDVEKVVDDYITAHESKEARH